MNSCRGTHEAHFGQKGVHNKVLSETKRTIDFALFKWSFKYNLKPIYGLHMYQNFVLHLSELQRYAWFHVTMCSTFGSVKKNKDHIFQKLRTSKDLGKSAFANLWSKNLFQWFQNLTKSYVGIILSANTSIKNNFLMVFFHFLRKCFGYYTVFWWWEAKLKF